MPARYRRALAAPLALLTCLLGSPAHATWPHDPYLGNVALCTAVLDQQRPIVVPDGAGGAVVVWDDFRSGTHWDICARRISASGEPLWDPNGVPVCVGVRTLSGDLSACPDASGGVIVAWRDNRGTNAHIYAQRISGAGVPSWTANGVAVCGASGGQYTPRAVSDGAGGAIIVWQDQRGAATTYAQRVNEAGAAQWTPDGIPVTTTSASQLWPAAAADGAGGVVTSWADLRTGDYDIFAQRLGATGNKLWGNGGVALTSWVGSQYYSSIAADGTGGAVACWQTDQTSYVDVWAQRVRDDGVTLWGSDGVFVSNTGALGTTPRIVTDGSGGAILAWCDARNTSDDVYAQRVSAAGVELWSMEDAPLCTATGDQTEVALTADGEAGAIAAWVDLRNGRHDIYAQRVDGTGAPLWAEGGVLVSAAPGEKHAPAVATDGTAGGILAWGDERNGATADIYAQRVERFGCLGDPAPDITSVADVPNDQGGHVKVTWGRSYLDAGPGFGIGSYEVWRSVPPNQMAAARARGARQVASFAERPAAGGLAFATTRVGATAYAWEYVAAQPGRGFLTYSYTLPTTSDSIGGSNPYTAVLVVALSSVSNGFWASLPDSGYSVDNLPPATPAPFTGEYASGAAHLHWNPNPEQDLAEYRLHRGTTPDFTPAPGNLVASKPDTGYVDPVGARFYYKLCAVDVHGNASGYALLLPDATVGTAAPELPGATWLAPAAPNPMRGAATIRFGLARAGRVELAVYDQQGRRLRTLMAGAGAAGPRVVRWDGRDDAGRPCPSGLYLVRLATEGRSLTRRAVLLW
jgi:hypothetical protein